MSVERIITNVTENMERMISKDEEKNIHAIFLTQKALAKQFKIQQLPVLWSFRDNYQY